MIAYTLVGTRNRQGATAVYDQPLAEVGGKRAMDLDLRTLFSTMLRIVAEMRQS